ncbi:MAG: hypothetical protein IPP52_10860 [Ignavibacteria bacterium]|nr:hypothetical protein [Ignavibacteria bacterium]
MKKIINLSFLTVILVIYFSSCNKEVPKELQNKSTQDNSEKKMPDDSIHRNLKSADPHSTLSENNSGTKNESAGDKTIDIILKDADEANARYIKTKSEADKEACIEKQMLAANFLMFEADLPPKEKYKPALVRYRRILEIDPSNKEAAANKKQIEDIYESMGKPIPN